MQMISGDPFSLSSSIIQPFRPEHPSNPNPKPNPPHPLPKKKRNLPGTPDPDAEVIALSPKSLMATNRFICEICNKGFQRDQNLQLHRRGHNLPWKLRQRSNKEVRKKVYICPEKTCVHHDPSRALGDLTGIKKHYSRKHGEKKWKCDKCSKKYAVQSDWKAHTKTCGTREYKCDCGTLFSRKDSFITHRAFCDALTEESARMTSVDTSNLNFKSEESSHVMMNSHSQPHGGFAFSQFGTHGLIHNGMGDQQRPSLSMWLNQLGNPNGNSNPLDVGLYNVSSSTASGLPDVYNNNNNVQMAPPTNSIASSSLPNYNSGLSSSASLAKSSSEIAKPASPMSATALLQKAAQMGSTRSTNPSIFSASFGVMTSSSSHTHNTQPSLDNNTDHHQNRSNELNQVFQSMKQQQADNNFGGSSSNSGHNNNGMMRMSNNTMNNNNNFVGSLTHSSSSGLDEVVLQQQPNARSVQGNNHHHHKQVLKDSSNSGEHGYTRDFLGMGGGEAGASAGHPSFLPQDIANFATMQPALLSEN